MGALLINAACVIFACAWQAQQPAAAAAGASNPLSPFATAPQNILPPEEPVAAHSGPLSPFALAQACCNSLHPHSRLRCNLNCKRGQRRDARVAFQDVGMLTGSSVSHGGLQGLLFRCARYIMIVRCGPKPGSKFVCRQRQRTQRGHLPETRMLQDSILRRAHRRQSLLQQELPFTNNCSASDA